jgi:hypothetical protein
MFTWEEAGLLRQMLLAVLWIAVAVMAALIVACTWRVVTR